jgi:hypothetical protein
VGGYPLTEKPSRRLLKMIFAAIAMRGYGFNH